MNSFFKWLYTNEHLPELFKIPRMKEEKKVLPSFSDHDLQRIISYRPEGFGQIRAHAIVLTLIDTGCRIEEPLTLSYRRAMYSHLAPG
jgi:integrase/recombinase XerD